MLFWGRRLWASCMEGSMPLCGFLLTLPQHPLALIEHENAISICLLIVALTTLGHVVQSLTHNWTLLLFPKTLTLHLGFWLMFLPLHETSPLTRSQDTYTGILVLALPGLYSGMRDSTYTYARPAPPHRVHLELRADFHMHFSTLISHFSLKWAGCLAISNNIGDLTYVKTW